MFTSVEFELFESQVLANNPLGDPVTRRVPVILPPGYDQDPERRYPVLYGLAGFSGRGQSMLNVKAWGINLQDRLEQLYANGMPHAIVVLPDCFTSLGGSQYRNSSAVGNYEDYVVKELVALIDQRYRTIAEPRGRGLFGKSSGGYGAFMLALRHPDVFSAFACHSGDMVFDLCYGPDFPKAANVFSAAGGIEAWWKQFQSKENKSSQDFEAINVLAMAACYSPNPSAPLGIDLPFDLHLCERREEVWARWLACDPYELVPMYTQALRAMRLVFFDCGNRDEFNLHYSARRMRIRLNELGIANEYQEFDAGHFNIEYRYDVSLPKLLDVLR